MNDQGHDVTEPEFDKLMHSSTPVPFVNLMVPARGWRRCCICFTAQQHESLFVDGDGERWDVCGIGPCAGQAGLTNE